MSPSENSTNLTARLGRWSASWLEWLPRLEHERPAEPCLEPQPEILAA